MARHFDEPKWERAIKQPNWYLQIADDFKRLMEMRKRSSYKVSMEVKEEVYGFFEKHLEVGDIVLGKSGRNWDKKRKPVDTIIIHHTDNPPGMTWQRLNAMHLIRLYAFEYAKAKGKDRDLVGRPVFSHHFRDGKQVFYAYHWLMRMDGKAERLLNDDEIGWQAGNWDVNCRSVAVCLDSDYEKASPSEDMIMALGKFIKKTYPQVKPENILGHCEVNPSTNCPGNEFLNKWKSRLIKSL